jgi:starch phosphorylase
MKPRPIKTFSIIPALPEPLKPLWDLAYNLRWAWKQRFIELFRRLDSDLWETTGHNPVLMLGTIDQARLEAATHNVGFMAQLERLTEYLNEHLKRSPRLVQPHPRTDLRSAHRLFFLRVRHHRMSDHLCGRPGHSIGRP